MRKVRYIGKFHTDAGEKLNEDSCFIIREKGITYMAVADGVGGLDKGEVASAYLVSSMKEWIKKNAALIPNMSTDDIKNSLHEQIMKMHESLKHISEEKEVSLGSTLTCALIKGSLYIIGHVGDSRAYLYSNGTTKLLTKDQTLYQLEADRGEEMSEDEIKAKSNTLLQCMGYAKIVPQYYEGILPDEYSVLICSDGLCNTLNPADFTKALSAGDDVEMQLKELTELARKRGETDNITSVCVRKNYL